MSEVEHKPPDQTVHRWLTLILQLIILAGLGLSIYTQQWLNAATITGILLLTLLPRLASKRLTLYIPAEFELIAVAFIFWPLRDLHGYTFKPPWKK